MIDAKFFVRAMWDDEAKVWHSETNIPGLVIEADSLAEFEALMNDLAPQMLAANANIHDAHVAVKFDASATRELAVA